MQLFNLHVDETSEESLLHTIKLKWLEKEKQGEVANGLDVCAKWVKACTIKPKIGRQFDSCVADRAVRDMSN